MGRRTWPFGRGGDRRLQHLPVGIGSVLVLPSMGRTVQLCMHLPCCQHRLSMHTVSKKTWVARSAASVASLHAARGEAMGARSSSHTEGEVKSVGVACYSRPNTGVIAASCAIKTAPHLPACASGWAPLAAAAPALVVAPREPRPAQPRVLLQLRALLPPPILAPLVHAVPPP